MKFTKKELTETLISPHITQSNANDNRKKLPNRNKSTNMHINQQNIQNKEHKQKSNKQQIKED